MIKTFKTNWLLIAIVLSILAIGAKYMYKFSPYRFEFLGHYHKIWAHRVNSIEKQEAALLFFKGIELDLDYLEETDFLDVNHTPAPSIGLSFQEYMDHLPINRYPYLWLDIKELDTLNHHHIFDKIHPVLRSKNYPLDRVLVEGMQVEALLIFEEAGFNTSLYLPWYLHDLSEEDLAEEIAALKSIQAQFPKVAFSSSYTQYDLIKEYFPEKELYIWFVGHRSFKEYSLSRRILKDDKVLAALSSYRSFKGGNR